MAKVTETTAQTEAPAADESAAPAPQGNRGGRGTPKTPWARRREMDFTNYREKLLGRNIKLIENIKPEAFAEHGVDRDELVAALKTQQAFCDTLAETWAKLPDDFPGKAKRAPAKKTFDPGDKVKVREKHHEKYSGAFDCSQVMVVAETKVGGNYVPIKTTVGDASQYFVSAAHLMHVTD